MKKVSQLKRKSEPIDIPSQKIAKTQNKPLRVKNMRWKIQTTDDKLIMFNIILNNFGQDLKKMDMYWIATKDEKKPECHILLKFKTQMFQHCLENVFEQECLTLPIITKISTASDEKHFLETMTTQLITIKISINPKNEDNFEEEMKLYLQELENGIFY